MTSFSYFLETGLLSLYYSRNGMIFYSYILETGLIPPPISRKRGYIPLLYPGDGMKG
jgi:hypothetical protein